MTAAIVALAGHDHNGSTSHRAGAGTPEPATNANTAVTPKVIAHARDIFANSRHT